MAKTRASTKSSDRNDPKPRKRYKNESFLKTLGAHCKQLRMQKGYSIDRLSKEADQLSPASINRLENGTADPQILVLVRYAEALGLNLLELFSFLKNMPELSQDSRILPFDEETKPPSGFVPVYSLAIAAGVFSQGNDLSEIKPTGWIDAGVRGPGYFASFIKGKSMEPRILDGSLCLFRQYTGGSRQGKIFLLQARGLKDNDTGESFVIKKYVRQTPIRSANIDEPSVIHLVSENKVFPPIVLVGMFDEEVQTLAEFIKVL